MTDRELLQMAAKAAGIPTNGKFRANQGVFFDEGDGAGAEIGWWNPLTDDGDNARLRRALRIVVQWFPTDVAAMHWSAEGRGRSWAEPYGKDPASAERRAVVRAAAALAPPRAIHSDLTHAEGAPAETRMNTGV